MTAGPVTRGLTAEGRVVSAGRRWRGTVGVRISAGFIALSLLGVLPASQAQGVVDRVQDFYEKTTDLTGQFHQRVELAIGQVEEAWGAFSLKRPGMMRWEYERPERRLLVTDGSTFWAYTPADRQVIVQDVKAAVTSLPFDFLMGVGKLDEQFVLREVRDQGDSYRLVLRPRRPDTLLREMEMEVEATTLYIRSLTLLDPYENRTVMRFSHLQINGGLPADLFSFVPPPGVKILRAEDLYPH
ncbi:MAG: outer membrane lipoprotein chaperone LolA [candidate division NC10 bacterium]